MKILFAICLCLSQFFIIQCSSPKKDYDSKIRSSNEYFPLKDNLSWKYINEAPREETVIIDVTCKSTGNGFQLDKFPFFGNTDSKMEVHADESGNIYVKEESGTSNLLLPASSKFEDGYKWKYTDLLGAYMTKTPVNVKTEAGTFDCIYISFTDGFTFSYEMWLAKDTGIVKWGANRTNPPSIPVYYVLKERKE